MNIIGLIVEYNPFHNGHLYQIKKIKEKYPNSILVAVMSSSFTQRGNISILNKWDKTNIALQCGIDLVIELPYIFTVQSADTFANKAIELLNNLKIDTLIFGIESENLDKIIQIAKTQLYNKEFNKLLKKYIKNNENYPTALSQTLKELLGFSVNDPNDLLAVSYVKEILIQNKNIKIESIKRTNEFHDITSNKNIVSASNIREKLLNKKSVKKYVPEITYYYLNKIKYNESNYLDKIKYKINACNLITILDVEKNIEKKIIDSSLISNTIDELIKNIKTKNYTYNRISRMINHIFVNLTKEDVKTYNKNEYIRVLGFTKQGKNYLSKIKNKTNLPIITNFTNKYSLLKYEFKITILYSIIFNDNSLIQKEYQNPPIIK